MNHEMITSLTRAKAISSLEQIISLHNSGFDIPEYWQPGNSTSLEGLLTCFSEHKNSHVKRRAAQTARILSGEDVEKMLAGFFSLLPPYSFENLIQVGEFHTTTAEELQVRKEDNDHHIRLEEFCADPQILPEIPAEVVKLAEEYSEDIADVLAIFNEKDKDLKKVKRSLAARKGLRTRAGNRKV